MKRIFPLLILFSTVLSQSALWGAGGENASAVRHALSDVNLSGLSKEILAREKPAVPPGEVEERGIGRDPFLLPGRKEVKGSSEGIGEWRLTAIIHGDGRGLAIINGTILREGDWIEGVLVKEIRSDRVYLLKGGQMVELRVNQFGVE